MSNWKDMLVNAMRWRGETLADIESSTLTDDEMARVFDSGFGSPEGTPFTVWTKNTVYFPLCYDGAEKVGSVSRHPDGKPTEHQGGG